MIVALVAGLAAALVLLASIIWSVAIPDRRLWPPKTSTHWSKIVVWALTLVIFGSVIYLGIADWNRLEWPTAMRWAVGLPLILVGNVVVWCGVAEIGIKATSGDAAKLQRNGLYRYWRNPQYVADMAILIGWIILSASIWVLPVASAGLLLLAIAPIAEEKWLEEVYGDEYRAYRATTRRYL